MSLFVPESYPNVIRQGADENDAWIENLRAIGWWKAAAADERMIHQAGGNKPFDW
jgi:hypothetical protein